MSVVLQPESRVDVGRDFVVRLDDALDVDVDEIVEGIYVLLDESFYFKKSGQQKPFVLTRSQSRLRVRRFRKRTSTLLIGSDTPIPRHLD